MPEQREMTKKEKTKDRVFKGLLIGLILINIYFFIKLKK